MSIQQALYCNVCEVKTIHDSKKTNHILHLLLSIITAGIWLIVWLLIADQNSHKRVCNKCGLETSARDHPENKAKSKRIAVIVGIVIAVIIAVPLISGVLSLFT